MNRIIANTEQLFRDIKTDFNSLWSFNLRGETLEILTPFSTMTGNIISVFLTMREDRFIVSDGQRLVQSISQYNFEINKKNAVFLEETANHYNVKKIENNNKCFYFKTTRDIKLISSYIYDLVFFQNTAFNSIYSAGTFFETESQDHWFLTRMNDLLQKKIDENKKFNRLFSIDRGHNLIKNAGFSTVLQYQGSSDIWAAMYISGSTPRIYSDHICRANTGFMYIDRKPEFKKSVKLAAIFDDDAKGYDAQNDRIRFARQIMDESFTFSSYTYTSFSNIEDLSTLYLSA